MNIKRRLDRNLATAAVAAATGKQVRFTYTNREGVTARRTVKPTGLKVTSKGVLMLATDSDGIKSFRPDRTFRMVTVKG